MTNCWFTADLPIDHRNIINLTHRSWHTIDKMNDALIWNWNTTVRSGGIVVVAGVFSHGKRIALVDKALGKAGVLKGYLEYFFAKLHTLVHAKGRIRYCLT